MRTSYPIKFSLLGFAFLVGYISSAAETSDSENELEKRDKQENEHGGPKFESFNIKKLPGGGFEVIDKVIEGEKESLSVHLLDSKGKQVDTYEDAGSQTMFHPVPMPTDFASYDILEKDGFITLEELVNVTGAEENVGLAFNASDKNGDGKLTPAEFQAAPWSLNLAPSAANSENNQAKESDTEDNTIESDSDKTGES